MKILGIGHSHLTCVQFAFDGSRSQLRAQDVDYQGIYLGDPQFAPFRVPTPSGVDGFQFTDGLRDAILRGMTEADLVVMCVGGNAYNMFGLVRHPRPFDFAFPGRPDIPLQPGFECMPWGLMVETFRQSDNFGLTVWFIKALTTLCGARLAHQLSAPPPAPTEHVLAHPDVFRAAIDQHGVNPLPIRYKLWCLQELLTEQVCAELGVSVIHPPAGIPGLQQHLPTEFTCPDPVHANYRYGQRMLEQVVRLKNAAFSFPHGS